MTEFIEYALRFKDLASSPMLKFGQTARSTFQRVGVAAESIIRKNQTVGRGYDALKLKVQALSRSISSSSIVRKLREARRELGAISSMKMPSFSGKGGGKAGGMLGGILGGMGGMAVMAGGAALMGGVYAAGALTKDAVSKSLERQQIQTSFNVLAGSEEKGGALTKELVGLQKDTVLGSEVFQNAQTMMGFGFDSTEVLPNMKMLGDVSMGDAQKLNSLTLAFSQVRAAGKLTGQDLLQFINAGFNPLQEMSAKTGKSIGELKGEVEKGKISFNDVRDAFVSATSAGGRFDDMMAKIAETPAGKVQQFEGELDEFKIKAGEAFMPLVMKALELAQFLLPIVEGFIQPMAEGISAVVEYFSTLNKQSGGFSDYIKIAVDYIQNKLLPFVLKIWNVLVDIIGQVVEFVRNSELLKDIISVVYALFGGVLDFVGWVVDKLKWVFDNVVMPILNAIEAAYSFIKEMVATPPPAGFSDGFIPMTGIVPLIAPDLLPTATAGGIAGNSTTNILTDIAKNTAENRAGVKKAKDDVVSGGQKVVNIHVGKFMEDINLHTVSLNEGTAEIQEIVMQMFSRILAGSVNNSI